MTTLVFQLQSLFIVFLMIYGVKNAKRNRQLHKKIMLSAVVWDLLLILQIELTRSAIAKAASVMTTPHQLLFYIHLFFAIGTVLLYPIVLYSGNKLLNQGATHKKAHRLLGFVTLLMRICTLFTSYFVVAARG